MNFEIDTVKKTVKLLGQVQFKFAELDQLKKWIGEDADQWTITIDASPTIIVQKEWVPIQIPQPEPLPWIRPYYQPIAPYYPTICGTYDTDDSITRTKFRITNAPLAALADNGLTVLTSTYGQK